MRETNASFLLKLTGGLLLLAMLAIIYLGSTLFDQGTRLTLAGRDQAAAEDQRDAVSALLGELRPQVPLPEVEAVADRAGIAYRVEGDAPSRRLVIEGLSFPVQDGIVRFQRD